MDDTSPKTGKHSLRVTAGGITPSVRRRPARPCCHYNLAADKWEKIEGWMNGQDDYESLRLIHSGGSGMYFKGFSSWASNLVIAKRADVLESPTSPAMSM